MEIVSSVVIPPSNPPHPFTEYKQNFITLPEDAVIDWTHIESLNQYFLSHPEKTLGQHTINRIASKLGLTPASWRDMLVRDGTGRYAAIYYLVASILRKNQDIRNLRMRSLSSSSATASTMNADDNDDDDAGGDGEREEGTDATRKKKRRKTTMTATTDGDSLPSFSSCQRRFSSPLSATPSFLKTLYEDLAIAEAVTDRYMWEQRSSPLLLLKEGGYGGRPPPSSLPRRDDNDAPPIFPLATPTASGSDSWNPFESPVRRQSLRATDCDCDGGGGGDGGGGIKITTSPLGPGSLMCSPSALHSVSSSPSPNEEDGDRDWVQKLDEFLYGEDNKNK